MPELWMNRSEHSLNIGGSTAMAMGTGNLTVNGTFDMFIGNLNGKCTVNFFGIPDASVSGTGVIDFYRVALNKGNVTATETVIPPVLEISMVFTSNNLSASGFLYTHTAGTLKIGGTFSQSNAVYLAAGYTIPLTGAFWLNNPNFTVTGQAAMRQFGLVRLQREFIISGPTTAIHGAGTWAVF
jgi:hypothetical protein